MYQNLNGLPRLNLNVAEITEHGIDRVVVLNEFGEGVAQFRYHEYGLDFEHVDVELLKGHLLDAVVRSGETL